MQAVHFVHSGFSVLLTLYAISEQLSQTIIVWVLYDNDNERP